MKKNIKHIVVALVLIALFLLEIVKYKIFHIDFNVIELLIRELIIVLIYGFSLWKLREKKWVNNFVTVSLVIFSLLCCVFSSFSSIGFLTLYLFILLITLVCMIKFKKNFEISLVISVSLLILFFILIGLLNLLSWSWLFLIVIITLSLFYCYKNKGEAETRIMGMNKTSFVIFTILFLIAILGGIGRYVHKWDEYSYWAYAAKVAIQENSLYSVISHLGATKGYPPVSNIWHYIVSVFCGYSESNLYIGLSILTFTYMMPIFMKIKEKSNYIIGIFVAAVIFCPTLFNGSIAYDLLYVDLLLGILCGSAIILHSNEDNKKKLSLPVLLILLIITLLKANGFVFSCSLLLLFYLKDVCCDPIKIKIIFTKIIKYILPGILIIGSFIAWRLLSNSNAIESLSYNVELMPDILRPDILPKLEPSFLLDFIDKVLSAIDEDIIYSFIKIPLFAYLIGIFGLIFYFYRKETEEKNVIRILAPYVLSYTAFYLITALSLFVMFSLMEASTLASFGRYLAPINIALLLYVLYKISAIENKKILNISCLILISFIGFSSITFFFTDLKERRETMHISEARQEIFADINKKTKEDDKIFIVNQTDEDSIMPIWYARYYCYPRIVNSSPYAITWKIKTESNEWDLKEWGLTKETFEEHLIEEKFDYVFFYSTTKELAEELSDLVDNEKDLKKNKLFKINKVDDSNITLEAIR